MKTFIAVLLITIPALAKDKPYVMTKPLVTIVRPYTRSTGSVGAYARTPSAPYTGSYRSGTKHPKF